MTELTPAGQSHRPVYCRVVQVNPGPDSSCYEKFTGKIVVDDDDPDPDPDFYFEADADQDPGPTSRYTQVGTQIYFLTYSQQ
jgi:hypothetical protein